MARVLIVETNSRIADALISVMKREQDIPSSDILKVDSIGDAWQVLHHLAQNSVIVIDALAYSPHHQAGRDFNADADTFVKDVLAKNPSFSAIVENVVGTDISDRFSPTEQERIVEVEGIGDFLNVALAIAKLLVHA